VSLHQTASPPPPTDEDAREGPTIPRDSRRSRRRRPVRGASIRVGGLSKRALAIGLVLYPPDETADVARPRTRSDCQGGARPCPFVSCAHHLYLDVGPTGSIKLNFPDVEPDELRESCVLDVAERGESTLEETGELMNLTRERVRQMQVRGLAKIRAEIETRGLTDLVHVSENDSPQIVEVLDDDDGDLDAFAFDVAHFSGPGLDE
jgi:hypothetical protein